MTESNSPTKTCSGCGIKKSLAAFLVLAEGSATYGSICADCRKAGILPKQINDLGEDGTTSNTSKTIDTKARIASEIDKRSERQQIEEEYYKEREENELVEKEETEDESEALKKEKEHHQQYLDSNPALPSSQRKQTPKRPTSSYFDQPAARDRARQQRDSKTHSDNEFAKQTDTQQTQHNKEETAKTQLDFSVPFQDTHIPGKIKYQSDVYKRFTSWLGTSSPLGRKAQEDAKRLRGDQEITPEEFIEKHWRPGSKK